MGYDSQCAYRLDGEPGAGKALLEQHALIVRGTARLIIPLASVTAATAAGRLADGPRSTAASRSSNCGTEAARWATRITNPPSRLSKLGIKAGQRILIAGPVEEAFVGEIESGRCDPC